MSDIRCPGGIEEIDRAAWDSLVPTTGFYQSYDWLRGQQRAAIASPVYVCVENDGVLVAATPAYEFPPIAAPQLPGVAEDRNALRIGTRTGYHNEFLVKSDHPGDHLGELVEATAAVAAERGYDALLFDFLTTDSLRRIAALFPVKAQLRSAEAVVHNTGGTFESYRKLLGQNVRKRDYEVRRFASAGLRIEKTPLSECVDEFAPLIAQTMDRYSSPLALDEIRAFLGEQARHLDRSSVVFRCLDETDRLIGGNVCFSWRDALYARVAGFDYTRTRNAFEYFNAVYYDPMRYMEAEGLTSLHLGLSAFEAKVRRGASLHPLWSCVVDLPLTRGAALRRDLLADAALAEGLRKEAGGGMDAAEWDLRSLAPL